MVEPKVTVLMPVYNGERYLNEAVDSILGQTFTDFEFLIIDDASTDKTPEILRSYDDPRIRVVTNEENLGLSKSLNKGLALARGEFIARMDADDVSYPYRLQVQHEFMTQHPGAGVIGSWAEYIDRKGEIVHRYRAPIFPEETTDDLDSLKAKAYKEPKIRCKRTHADKKKKDKT